MQVTVAVDIEEALRVDLSDIYERLGKSAQIVATMLPADLGEIPQGDGLIAIRRVGGSRTDLVSDTMALVIDVYYGTWEASMTEANFLAGIISQLPYQDDTSTQYLRADISTMPYALPDAGNPVFPRVRMLVEMGVKARIETLYI